MNPDGLRPTAYKMERCLIGWGVGQAFRSCIVMGACADLRKKHVETNT